MAEIGEYGEFTEENAAGAFYTGAENWRLELNLAAMYLSEEEFEELANKAIEELDAVCPYFEQVVYISGRALMPMSKNIERDDFQRDETRPKTSIKVIDHDEEEGIVYGEVDCLAGIHNGVRVELVVDDMGQAKWVFRQVIIFAQGTYLRGQGTRSGQEVLTGFFEMDSEVVPAEEIVEAIYGDEASEPPDDIVSVIGNYSITLAKLINSRKFRSMPHASQKNILNRWLGKVESATESVREKPVYIDLDTKLKTKPRLRTAKHAKSYVYVPQLNESGEVTYKRKYLAGKGIGGLCLGVVCLDAEMLSHRPLRKNTTAVDKRAGLFFIVDPDEETVERLKEDKVIFAPAAGNFDAIFE